MNRRLATDIYARGVARGSVECTNLIINSQHHDPTSAETIKTAETTPISAHYGLNLLQASFDREAWPVEQRRQRPDRRRGAKQVSTPPPFWTAYGSRGRRSEVHMLSAYEYSRHYFTSTASRPLTLESHWKHQQHPEKYRARLTEQGVEKLAKHFNPGVLAGKDYHIREEGGSAWVPFGACECAQAFRHDWVMAKRPRPHVPVIYGAQSSKTEEEQVMRILLLFIPWVNNAADATAEVPFIGALRLPYMQTWRHALRFRLIRHGFPTEEIKRLALKYCDVYCLPRSLQPEQELVENSDNEGMVDEELHFNEEDLLAARSGVSQNV